MKKLLTLLSLSVFLSGCIPAALVIGATAGGAVIYDKRSIQTIVHDKDAASVAASRINAAPSLQKNTHIIVAVFNHIMLLAGQTATTEQRQTAYDLALKAKNVSRTFNEITVEKPTSLWRRSKDAWITTKVKSEMLAKKGLQSTQIKVVTENAVVYLMGVITHKQAEMAANVSRRVNGVKKVVKVFEYPQ